MPALKQAKEGRYLESDEWRKLELRHQNIWQSKWFRELSKETQAMVREMVEQDYWFFTQTPYLLLIEIEAQDVYLPFTNGFCIAILKKIDGNWKYLCRWSEGRSLTLDQEINIMYSLEL